MDIHLEGSSSCLTSRHHGCHETSLQHISTLACQSGHTNLFTSSTISYLYDFNSAIHTTESISSGKATMAMLTKLIFVFTAMAMVATALVVPPNMTSSSTRFLHKRTPLPHDYGVHTPNTLRTNKETKESENTYTAQQIEKFQAGHNDALMMCRTVIEEATKSTPDRFDRIFREYFPFSDRQLVIGKYKATALLSMS